MLPLSELKPGQSIVGLEPSTVSTVVAVVSIGSNTVRAIYTPPDGALKDRLLGGADEPSLSLATTGRPWSFDGAGADFQLTCEAKRIDLAFLFDPMMAVYTSKVEPLPHQITAVYVSMLPRQPLRYVLADDPGAGKTIMPGFYIRELVMRADAGRVLIVAPGGLVDQWREELFEKFGLEFRVYSPPLEQASPSGNPFEDYPQLIVRLDQMARNEDLQAKLCASRWDLVVFGEAHKLAVHFFGSKVETTARFRFAERLGRETHHLRLMTATPAQGQGRRLPTLPPCSTPTASTAVSATASTRSTPPTSCGAWSRKSSSSSTALRFSPSAGRTLRITSFPTPRPPLDADRGVQDEGLGIRFYRERGQSGTGFKVRRERSLA
jgi:hypothetical protein